MDWKQRLDLHFRKLALEAQGARAAEFATHDPQNDYV
jgi:hypothetical protein